MIALALVTLAALFVAYTNGANDNFKGVATLFGSGTTSYRKALAWGTVTTLAGSVTALVFSEKLVSRFSGKGLVPDALVGDPHFVGAVALAAALTVFLATWLAFPISTTHALTGALVGAGLVRAHGEVHLGVLGTAFFLPLVASPVMAMALSLLFYPTVHGLRTRAGIRRETCVCLNREWVPVALAPDGAALGGTGTLSLETCQERYQGTLFSITAHRLLDGAHYLSAGAVSFARGLNDTPKIVALLVAAHAMGLRGGMVLVGLVMAVGAVLHARKVAETMSHKITKMNHGQGFSANLVTAALVVVASRFGLPVSTTHVSCGALFGIGMVTRQARWKMIGSVLLAWVITLPTAAVFSAVAAKLL
ncbi:MAG TPA: anion permease [Planctomycetota bacterium]|jgi:PiT family inorganic phosphate transporter|nr:anion permease [Planctomycetota bacterium]